MKVKEWTKLRREIKPVFEKAGIVTCENCGGSFALGFAHRVKRRFLTTDEEKRTVALLCQPCHERIEFSGHEEMFRSITEIIERRNEQIETTA